MHLHIASVSEAVDAKGNVYKVFDIYINGVYHSSLRYSQLLDMSSEIKKQFDTSKLVEFPPKILRISEVQLLVRRRQLERYLHCVCQDRVIGSSNYFMDYMLASQQVCSSVSDGATQQQVYLCNGKSTTVEFSTYDRASHILEAACKAIGLDRELAYHFVLCLEYASCDDSNDWRTLCPLFDFQAPYITLQTANTSTKYQFRLAIRKWFFDPYYNHRLLESQTGINLLYIEAVKDYESDMMVLESTVNEKLKSFKKSSTKKVFVTMLSEQPRYGYKMCPDLKIQEGGRGYALIGGKEIIVCVRNGPEDTQKTRYPISKLRCWKVGVLKNSLEHFISVEHECGRNEFEWITLRGESTILLTLCLYQSVNEFLMAAKKEEIKAPSDRTLSTRPSISHPPVSLREAHPPGIDLDMAVIPDTPPDDDDNDDNDEPDLVQSSESQSSQESSAKLETAPTTEKALTGDDKVKATPTTSKEVGIPKEDAKARTSSEESGIPCSTVTTRNSPSTSFSKQPKSKSKKRDTVSKGFVWPISKKEEEALVNPTFLMDDDL